MFELDAGEKAVPTQTGYIDLLQLLLHCPQYLRMFLPETITLISSMADSSL